jgi:hypothetical protein
MAVRKINFTGRKRIRLATVDILLSRTDSGNGRFDARIDLSSYGFPADARVFVEAYRQATIMRFDFGTVSTPIPPAVTELTDFDSPDEVLFRVRVTAVAGDSGKLLGEADQVRPRRPEERPEDRIPLLPPVPENLGQEIWRVDFDGDTWLKVNSELPDWKETTRSPVFRALVYPAAMRQILERILLVEKVTVTDDPRDWRSRWLRFASSLPGSMDVPADVSDFEEWIENAVSSFARRWSMRTRYQSSSE